MREVTRFQSKDGMVFNTKDECLQNEKTLLFGEWYYKHVLYGMTEGCCIGVEDIVNWLHKYRLQVLEFLDAGE